MEIGKEQAGSGIEHLLKPKMKVSCKSDAKMHEVGKWFENFDHKWLLCWQL